MNSNLGLMNCRSNDNEIGIISYNCNGLADNKKRKNIFCWLKDKPQDFFCLQETHSTSLDEEQWKKEWDGPAFFSHGDRKSRGVMIMVKQQVDFFVDSIERCLQGRWLMLNITIKGHKMCILNLYGPNRDEPSFFDGIKKMLQEQQGEIVIVGDFNVALDKRSDRKGNTAIDYHPHALKSIQNVIDAFDLIDIWRFKNPNLTRYTWRRQNQASRIDYFLISFSLINKVTGVSIEDKLRSDHNCIGLNLAIDENTRGPGYWKFNQTLLHDEEFNIKMREFIADFFKHNEGSANPQIVWEAFKCSLRGYAIAYSSWKKKQFKITEQALKKEIEDLQQIIDENENPPNEQLNNLTIKQEEMAGIIENRLLKSYDYNRATWMKKGEKCSKFFLSMKKNNIAKKNISKIILSNGNILSSQSTILIEIENYFKNIFSYQATPPKNNIFFP